MELNRIEQSKVVNITEQSRKEKGKESSNTVQYSTAKYSKIGYKHACSFTSLWLHAGVVGDLVVPVFVCDPMSIKGCAGGWVVELVVGWLVGRSVKVNGGMATPEFE